MMDSEGSGDGDFLHQGIMNSSPSSGLVANSTSDKVSGVTMCSESLLRAPNALDPFYGSSNWDHLLVSLIQGGNFGDSANDFVNVNPHSSSFLENQAPGSSSHLAHIPPHSGLPDHMLPKMIPGFGCHSEFSNKNWLATQMPSTNIDDHCQDHSQGGRKRKASIQNAEDKQQKDPSRSTPEIPKEDEKQQKLGSNAGQKSQSQNKQVKDSNGAEPSKENYIHVRAKRGQATNSHSLAERVRRERISERMRLLQELVPGCNKITGKAMMLDEIINYVQSLQQQVEFLSMKLATVNPEVNMDMDRILSKEILHFHGSDAATPVINAGLSSLHRLPGYPLDGAAATTPQFLPPTQHMWNKDLQGILHTGFEPDPSGCSLGLNGNFLDLLITSLDTPCNLLLYVRFTHRYVFQVFRKQHYRV